MSLIMASLAPLPDSRAPSPGPALTPRNRLAALLAQWRNAASPENLTQDNLHQSIGTLRIVLDYVD